MVNSEKIKKAKKFIEEHTINVTYTVSIHRSESRRNNIRVKPICKIHPEDDKYDEIRLKLLTNGVTPTEQDTSLVLGSISSCLIALKYLNPPKWWRRVLYMMEDGKHTEKEGILAIIKKRNDELDSKGKRKWTKERALEEMSKN